MRFLLSVLVFAIACILGVSASDAERLRMIKAVNSNPNATWTAGLQNRFRGQDFSAVKRQLGVLKYKNVPDWEKLPRYVHTGFDVAALPTNFDSRTAWPFCPTIQEVRDQSDCGSCWAFGTVEAASDRACIETKGASKPHLAADDLLSCCSACGFGCQGGDPGAAWSFLTQTGVVTGGNYNDYSMCVSYPFPICEHHTTGPYPACTSFPEFNTPNCPSACDANSTYTTSYQQDKHIFATSYSVASDPVQIQQEILANGPVTAAFTVYADFETYTGGVYHHVTGDELGGHAVKIIGWGVDEESNAPYWLVANSWNPTWGEKGFFRILRGSDECGIEDNIVAGLYTQSKAQKAGFKIAPKVRVHRKHQH